MDEVTTLVFRSKNVQHRGAHSTLGHLIFAAQVLASLEEMHVVGQHSGDFFCILAVPCADTLLVEALHVSAPICVLTGQNAEQTKWPVRTPTPAVTAAQKWE